MKIALAYTVFNGLELLKPAIEHHKELVDEIIICYQTTSNKGEVNTSVEHIVKNIADRTGAHVIMFAPDLRMSTKQNEIIKHNLMLQYAKKIRCSHIVMSATDHFYVKKEFTEAVNHSIFIDANVTFTKMYTYFKYPTWQLTPMEDYCMPFLIKINSNTKFERTSNFPVYIDPSIQVNTCRPFYLFEPEQICMHHYSMVRHDIVGKFKNAAASIRWTAEMVNQFIDEAMNYDIKTNLGVKYFQGRKIKVVQDWFGLSRSLDLIP